MVIAAVQNDVELLLFHVGFLRDDQRHLVLVEHVVVHHVRPLVQVAGTEPLRVVTLATGRQGTDGKAVGLREHQVFQQQLVLGLAVEHGVEGKQLRVVPALGGVGNALLGRCLDFVTNGTLHLRPVELHAVAPYYLAEVGVCLALRYRTVGTKYGGHQTV